MTDPFHTILMDYEMPIMNGPSATQKLVSMGCKAVIVGITGNVLPDDVNYFKQCGAEEVLPKPLAIEKLEEIWKRPHVEHMMNDETLHLPTSAPSAGPLSVILCECDNTLAKNELLAEENV